MSEDLIEVQLFHPITHDGTEYGRGVHRLPPDVAAIFMKIEHPVGDTGRLRIAQPFKPETMMGSVKRAPDADAGKTAKSRKEE